MSLVEVNNLCFSYGGVPCLEDISLDIAAGDFVALVGPNGAGKSSLLKCIAGDFVLDSGGVCFSGKPVGDYSVAQLSRLRSVMEQNTDVSFDYLVHDVVMMGRSCVDDKLSRADEESFIQECLVKADIEDLQFRKVCSLSGGEKARVALCRVLAQNCPVVLLDEPTASLDIKHQESTMRVAKQLADSGCGVVVVLHDLNLAAAYCNKVVLLKDGRVVDSGSFAKVFNAQVLSDVYQCPINVVKDNNGLRVEPVRIFD